MGGPSATTPPPDGTPPCCSTTDCSRTQAAAWTCSPHCSPRSPQAHDDTDRSGTRRTVQLVLPAQRPTAMVRPPGQPVRPDRRTHGPSPATRGRPRRCLGRSPRSRTDFVPLSRHSPSTVSLQSTNRRHGARGATRTTSGAGCLKPEVKTRRTRLADQPAERLRHAAPGRTYVRVRLQLLPMATGVTSNDPSPQAVHHPARYRVNEHGAHVVIVPTRCPSRRHVLTTWDTGSSKPATR
jgi:hypothetical protein